MAMQCPTASMQTLKMSGNSGHTNHKQLKLLQEGQSCGPMCLVYKFWLILQLKILGPQYGMWGLRKYGTSLTQVDALVFWPDRLTCLADMIKIEQEKARKLAVPSAFVTFKSVAALHAESAVLCPGCAMLSHAELCYVTLLCGLLCSAVPC